MTLFEAIGFSLAIIALSISVLSILTRMKKQQKDMFNVFLKLTELQQKLEDKLPFQPTVQPLEPASEPTPDEPTPEPSTDPVPTEPESQEEPTPAKPKPYGVTYKVVAQAEKMVRDVEETAQLTGVSKNKIYSGFSVSMDRNRTWFNTMVKSWLETEPKRSPKVLENVIETRKKLRQYLKQLKLDTIQTVGIVLYDNIKIDSNLYEVRELSTKQYESIKALKAPSLFILLDQKLNLAYGSWNNGQPELVQLPDARIFDSTALDTILRSLKEEGISLRIALLVPKK